jgi:uncharacterized protein (TIRG00374 family)
VTKQFFWTLVKYGLGFALLAGVIWWNWEPSTGPGLKEALQKPIHVGPLLAGVGVCLIGLLLTFIRWYVLVRALDLPFTVHDSLRLGMIGYALSTFLPGSIGGDVIKAACLAREQNRRTAAVATVIFDRLIGLCGLVWLVAALGGVFWLGGSVTNPKLEIVLAGAWVLTVTSFLFWLALGLVSSSRAEALGALLVRLPKVGGPLRELWRSVLMYRQRSRSVCVAMGLALVGHVGFVLTYYFGTLTILGPDEIPSLEAFFLFVPVVMIVQAVFLLPGGLGATEIGFGWFFSSLGFSPANGVLGSLIQRAIGWALALVGYLIYLRMRSTLVPGEPKTAKSHAPAAAEMCEAAVSA